MPKRWSEPGWDTWFKAAIWALLLAVLVYGIVLLGSALARRFRAIKRSYQVPAAQYKRLCAAPPARAPDPSVCGLAAKVGEETGNRLRI
jgi:hypothetical protein